MVLMAPARPSGFPRPRPRRILRHQNPSAIRIRLLRTNRTCRNLWLASAGSQLGDWFNEVALAQVTLSLMHSPAAMGLALLCRSLPGVVLGPLVGPLVDRLPKRPLLLATDLLRALIALSLSLSVLADTTLVLYVASALLGIGGAFFAPARNAAIPFVVAREDLAIADSLEAQAAGVIQVVGAACGGIVAATVGPIVCFAVNGASYLWSAWHIARCRWDETDRLRNQESYAESVNAGLREAAATGWCARSS